MKRTRDILTVVAIAGAAFIAGRLGLPIVSSSSATAQDNAEHQDMELTPEQKAWAEAATPGKNHKYLENLIGEFDATGHFRESSDGEKVEFTGSIVREWILDGRYIKETIDGKSEMGPYNAVVYIGYNNIDGQYELVTMENVSTAIMSSTGTYNPDTKVLFMSGKYRDAITHKLITHWNKINIGDSSRQTVKGWMVDENGREFVNFEGVFERK